jgi:hypothetical protein
MAAEIVLELIVSDAFCPKTKATLKNSILGSK